MDNFSPIVESAIAKMSEKEKLVFKSEYDRKKRDKGLMIVLAVIFPIQLFLLRRVGLGLAFWLTGWGALFWWIIEWFLTSRRVDECNEEIATDIARDIKIMM